MAIILGVFGSVTNATKSSALLLNVLYSGPPAYSLCVKSYTSCGSEHLGEAEYPLYGGSGEALWNEAGLRDFTILITYNFEPEIVDSSAYSNVRDVAKGKSLASTNPSSDRLTNGTGHSH